MSSSEKQLTTKKSWYAWVISGSGFITQFGCVIGLIVWGYNVSYLSAEFGLQVSDVAIAASLYSVLYTGMSFLWGWLADRIGSRISITIGMVGLGLFLFLVGNFSSSITLVIVFYAIAGFFASAIGSSILPKLIAGWYGAKFRGRGYMINNFGGSLGGIVLGIVAPMLILNAGWRGCYTVIGIAIIVLGVMFFLLCRNVPEDLNTVPFGMTVEEYEAEKANLAAKAAEVSEEDQKNNIIEVLKMPITWKFGAVFIFWYFWFSCNNAYRTAAITASGFDITVAGLVGTFLTAFMAIGMFVSSFFSDKVSRKKTLGVMIIVAGIMYMGLWVIFGMGNPVLLLAYYAVMGLFMGNTPILQSTTAEMYPIRLRGTGPGVITTIGLVGSFFGPILGGAIISALGATQYFVFFAGGMYVIAGILALLLLPNTGGKYGDPMAKED